MWELQSRWPIADWLERVEPAPPGEDRVPCQDRKYMFFSTTPTPRERKPCSPGSTPTRTMWKAQRRCRSLIDCDTDNEPAQPGEDKAPSLLWNLFHASTYPTTGILKRKFPGLIPLGPVWKPQPNPPKVGGKNGSLKVGSNTQHYTKPRPVFPVDRQTTQTAAAQTDTTATIRLSHAYFSNQDGSESGDPPIRYGGEFNCFRGYHLRPSHGADQ